MVSTRASAKKAPKRSASASPPLSSLPPTKKPTKKTTNAGHTVSSHTDHLEDEGRALMKKSDPDAYSTNSSDVSDSDPDIPAVVLKRRLKLRVDAQTDDDFLRDGDLSKQRSKILRGPTDRSHPKSNLERLRAACEALPPLKDPDLPTELRVTLEGRVRDLCEPLKSAPERFKTVKRLRKGQPPRAPWTYDDPLVKIQGESAKLQILDSKTDVRFSIYLPFKGTATLQERDDSLEIIPHILAFYNRWAATSEAPIPLSQYAKETIVHGALLRTGSSLYKLRIPYHTVDSKQYSKWGGFRVVVRTINRYTGKEDPITRRGNVKDIAVTRDVPDLPANAICIGRDDQVISRDENGQVPSLLQASLKAKLSADDFAICLAHEKLTRYIVWQLDGMVCDQAEFDKAWEKLEHFYTSRKMTGRRNLVSDRIFTVDWKKGYMSIHPGHYFRKLGWGGQNLDNQLHLQLNSNDALWWYPIRELAKEQVASRAVSPMEVLENVARALDEINELIASGTAPPASCNCTTAEEKASSSHPCSACGADAACNSLGQDWRGLWVCETCFSRQATTANLAQHAMERSISRSIESEAASVKLSDAETTELRLKAIQALSARLKDLPPSQYPDAYTGNVLRTVPVGFHPEGLSVDACDRHGLLASGKVFKHVSENLEITTMAENLTKKAHLLGEVAECGLYISTPSPPATDVAALQQKVDGLLQRQRELVTIRLKHSCEDATPKTKLSRTQLDERLEECRSGKLSTGGKISPDEWQEHADLMTETGLKGGKEVAADLLTERQRENIVNIYREIHEKFPNSKLCFAKDGAPWFCQYESMPPQWKWRRFERYWKMKEQTMRLNCNRWWVMKDTLSSIACESFYQLCDPDHQDFLGLPITHRKHYLTHLSCGKQEHGRQMWTGFPPDPTCLADRENDRTKTNFKIDTEFGNMLQFDFPAKHQGLLKALAAKMHLVPRHRYDRNLPRPTTGQSGTLTLEQFDLFDTAELNQEVRCPINESGLPERSDDQVGIYQELEEAALNCGVDTHREVVDLLDQLKNSSPEDDEHESIVEQLREYIEKVTQGEATAPATSGDQGQEFRELLITLLTGGAIVGRRGDTEQLSQVMDTINFRREDAGEDPYDQQTVEEMLSDDAIVEGLLTYDDDAQTVTRVLAGFGDE